MTNIMSLNNIRDKLRVTYNIDGDFAFTFHKPNWVLVRIVIQSDRIHYHYTGNRQLSMLTTVKQDS